MISTKYLGEPAGLILRFGKTALRMPFASEPSSCGPNSGAKLQKIYDPANVFCRKIRILSEY